MNGYYTLKRYYTLKHDPDAKYEYEKLSLDCPTAQEPANLAQIVADAVGEPGVHLVSVRVKIEVLQSQLIEPAPVQPETNGNGHPDEVVLEFEFSS